MKNKKPTVLYDPSLIWACSLDLSGVRAVPSDLRIEPELENGSVLPTDPRLKKEEPDRPELN